MGRRRADGGVGAEAWNAEHDSHRRAVDSGSSLIDKDVVLAADADVIGHINGGHTALPDAQIRGLCEESPRALEIVHNEMSVRRCLHCARRKSEALHRVIWGRMRRRDPAYSRLGLSEWIAALSSIGRFRRKWRFALRPETPRGCGTWTAE